MMLSLGGGYEYVDLGLPSGLKWAKCNIGAATETEYGDYFMWGSVTPNTADECRWASYTHCDGSFKTLTKYNTSTSYGKNPDNITVLGPEDDAATHIMGGDWRMPTKAEFDELSEKTDNQWIANYNGTGVNGRKFTSKTDKNKYIFIPTAGYCNNGSVDSVGGNGSVWSSSLYTSGPGNAWYLNFHQGNYGVSNSPRYLGLSVRGVRK